MIATIPPRGHFADASVSWDADGDYTLSVGTAEFGNGTSTVHAQIIASELGIGAEMTGQKKNRNVSYQAYIALLTK